MRGALPIASTARGARHVINSYPSEDACGSLRREGLGVVAVSDGVSDPRCPHAARGAQLAVLAGIATAIDMWGRAAEAHLFGPRVVANWRRLVQDSDLGGPDVSQVNFAATLSVAISDDRDIMVARIGDGDLICSTGPEGHLLRPLTRAEPGASPETLAHPDASDAFEVLHLCSTDLDIRSTLICTDGFTAPFAEPDWDHIVASNLERLRASVPLSALVTAADGWTQDSGRVGGDDASVGLLVRRPPRT